MSSRFKAKKQAILQQLAVPEEEYHDLSPKGSIDLPIRSLIGEINRLKGLVTTSSCSGRISVFLEGRKRKQVAGFPESQREGQDAGPGGKGGGSWLYISHDPMKFEEHESSKPLMTKFGMRKPRDESEMAPSIECSFIHLKFEPMILHILTASMKDSHQVLTGAMNAGFRESGAMSLSPSKSGEINPMVAIRSTGYSFDAIIGFQNECGDKIAMVDEPYLQTLTAIANERFVLNLERIFRFRSSLLQQFEQGCEKGASDLPAVVSSKPAWEDSEARKQRKREEGLKRQRALQTHCDKMLP
ncbi:tRNA wybutosine-synthesizing protein [Clohesyomyces aquaticus]|uniref:tRNA(Phe) 7-[(3-amino-3-carboxypropyl)-4-demethylwyosine(37)-N(4)]-methyltransferase n=1 Tax=Clohesyomyces aquaticus TaxID=1231657 RepID=A0A1Y1ZPW7_9PLEO|nr:tRNA wybutosine-synthesizing protein [Clohesyomyces aquaticus]